MHLCCQWVRYMVTGWFVSVESYLVAGSRKLGGMLWGWDCWPGLRTRASSARFYFGTWAWLIWVFKVSSRFVICQLILSTLAALMKLNIGYSIQLCKGLQWGRIPVKWTCLMSWDFLDQNVKLDQIEGSGSSFWTGLSHFFVRSGDSCELFDRLEKCVGEAFLYFHSGAEYTGGF